MKNQSIIGFVVLCFGLLSCGQYQTYEIAQPIINQINLKGNSQVSNIALRTNVLGIKNSYRRVLPAKLYTYLGNKRKRKDSLQIKPSFIQFFKSPNPSYSSNWVQTNLSSIQRYYRENGFLKAKVTPIIDSIDKLRNITFIIDEGQASYFTKK